MGKQILILLFIISPLSLVAETVYEVVKNSNEIVSGYIIEDRPGEFILLENEVNGDIVVIPYLDIIIIRPKVKTEETFKIPSVLDSIVGESIVIESIIIEPVLPEYKTEDFTGIMGDLSLTELNKVVVDSKKLRTFPLLIKIEMYNELKKDDTLKFTFLNLLPGFGSILQGDYYSGFYTLASVVSGILYNMGSNSSGTDLYFIINLHGALAYITGFFAPLRYNLKYNQLIKEKLLLD